MNASEFDPAHSFEVAGVSYAGAPRSGTAMFLTHKLAHLLDGLRGVRHCLVFVDESTPVPEDLRARHCILPCPDPEAAYGRLAERFWAAEEAAEKQLRYTLTDGGYYVGEGVSIGENVTVEPMVLIGHGVSIGNGTRIESGARIYHATVGSHCLIRGNTVVGSQSFFHYYDENHIKRRLYQLGNVVIEDHVEIGACATVNRAVANSTILRRWAKVDDHVYIPHDCELGENCRVVGAAVLGGFCHIGRDAFIGLNAVLRNRITVGQGATVGTGSVVTRDVPPHTTVYGNPARPKK